MPQLQGMLHCSNEFNALQQKAPGLQNEPMKQARSNWIAGPIRPKSEPPTIDEAIAAARCISASVEAQIEIAAALIGVEQGHVRQRMLELKDETQIVVSGLQRPRTVIVERRVSRNRSRVAS
jgi:hypothetical protein